MSNQLDTGDRLSGDATASFEGVKVRLFAIFCVDLFVLWANVKLYENFKGVKINKS